MSAAISWQIEQRGPSTWVRLSGEFTEAAALEALVPQLSGPVTVDLAEIHRINSYGVRVWTGFAEALIAAGKPLFLERCSVPFVVQMNQIVGFSAGAAVRSVFAPYACVDCLNEFQQLVELSPGASPSLAPTMVCPRCSGTMQFDENFDGYLIFARS